MKRKFNECFHVYFCNSIIPVQPSTYLNVHFDTLERNALQPHEKNQSLQSNDLFLKSMLLSRIDLGRCRLQVMFIRILKCARRHVLSRRGD
jgi:hypothetical protein